MKRKRKEEEGGGRRRKDEEAHIVTTHIWLLSLLILRIAVRLTSSLHHSPNHLYPAVPWDCLPERR